MPLAQPKEKLRDCKCDRPNPYLSNFHRRTNVCKSCGGFIESIDKEIKEEEKRQKEKREKAKVPPYSSKEYPNWVCKGGCGTVVPSDSSLVKCPNCRRPLIRWLRYEEKK